MSNPLLELLGAPPEPTPGYNPEGAAAPADKTQPPQPTAEKPPKGEPLRRDVTRHGFPADTRWCQYTERPDGTVEWSRRTDGRVKTKPRWHKKKIANEISLGKPDPHPSFAGKGGSVGGVAGSRGGELAGVGGNATPNSASPGAVSDGSEGDWFIIPMERVAELTGKPKKYRPSDSVKRDIRESCARMEFPQLPPEVVLLGAMAMWALPILFTKEARDGILESIGIDLEAPAPAELEAAKGVSK